MENIATSHIGNASYSIIGNSACAFDAIVFPIEIMFP